MTKKERARLEKQFLSAVADGEDCRGRIAAEYAGVRWRDFADRRHQALWRALQTIAAKGADERMDIAARELGGGYEGEAGSAAARLFGERLIARTENGAWLERELEAAGMLPLVGGKAYLREILAEFPAAAAGFARQLGFRVTTEGKAGA